MKSLDDLISLSVEEPGEAQALAAYLRRDKVWAEVVAGIDSVVVQFDAARMDIATAERRLGDALGRGVPPLEARDALLEIPVVYGGEYGPDLEALCNDLGMTEDELVAMHTGTECSVDMIGFTPGFAFIGGLDERLDVARRKQPRQRVAAGSVGIADGRTGIYALPSPGGWTLIGRTPLPLFDPTADDPFRMRAGTRVRFVAVAADAFPV